MPYEAAAADEDAAIVQMKGALSCFETEDGRLKGFQFRPRPDDVMVVTSPKAGTTWLQQLTHQLRTKGSMAFDEISTAVPWLELAHDLGQDLEAPQPGSPPRLFKTHAWYDDCPKGARYIVGVRAPEDVAWSFFRFFDGWFIQPPGSVSFETFAHEFILKRGRPASRMENASYWHHLVSWLEYAKQRPKANDVLLVCFEDLKHDLEAQVRRIAAFLGYAPGTADFEERVRVATDHSTMAFMKAHAEKFDEHLTKQARNGVCGLPPDAGKDNSKLRQGNVGGSQEAMTAELKAALQKKWDEVVTPALGLCTYAELLVWHRERQEKDETK